MAWPGIEPVGIRECRDRRLLESAVSLPLQSAFGHECYVTIHQKAACLFHSLIANHPFSNGNKRTAVLALDLFLLSNSHFLSISNENMFDLSIETASQENLLEALQRSAAVPITSNEIEPPHSASSE
jgi:death-on-curing protein